MELKLIVKFYRTKNVISIFYTLRIKTQGEKMAGFIQEKISVNTPLVPTDFRHSLCTGETGSGKTSSFVLPNMQNRLKDGYGILVVDFKGNMHTQVKALAHRENRLDDVIEIGVPWGSKINLFKHIPRALFLDTLNAINGETKDRFWLNSALNLAGDIYDVFTLHENLIHLLKDNKKLSFDYTFNAKSLNEIVLSFSSLKTFINECKDIDDELNVRNLVTLYEHGMAENRLQLVRQFAQEFQESTNKISSFYDEIDSDSPASGNGGVFFVLRNLFSIFLQTGLDGELELKSLLEQGKVIIIRSDSYEHNVTLALMNILYKRLLVRNNSRPLALFIDEFQRSIGKDNIPYVDLFREMKVELIAAVQNIQQLENKIGKSECDEFMGNILYNYEYADHRENNLATFEYLSRGRKSIADPIFISKKESILVQMKWQETCSAPLEKGWIYYRVEGHKRAIIMNVRTKENKFHYILENEDVGLQRRFDSLSSMSKAS